jgi:hypothetical protein
MESSMELQNGGVSKTYITDVQAVKDVTHAIPAGMCGSPGPTDADRSA